MSKSQGAASAPLCTFLPATLVVVVVVVMMMMMMMMMMMTHSTKVFLTVSSCLTKQ